MIVLAVALVFNLPAMLQRAVPDYTDGDAESPRRQRHPRTLNSAVHNGLTAGSALQSARQREQRLPTNCTDGSTELQQCGPAPAITGITGVAQHPGRHNRSTPPRCGARWS